MLRTLALSINNYVFYGWLLLLVCAIGIFATGPGQSHTFSPYLPILTEELGISQSAYALFYGGATLCASFLLPFVGKAVDRHGARKVILFISIAFSLAAISFSQVNNVVVLVFGFGLLRLLGQGSLMLCCNNMISQWFSAKRGIALGIMSWGFALSMALHPELALHWIATEGWRNSWVFLGLLSLVLLVPLMFLFAYDRPEQLGLEPDGGLADPTDDKARLRASANTGMTLSQATSTSTFWIIAIGLMTLAGLITALFLFQVSIFENQGAGRELGVKMFKWSALTMVICVPIVGRLLDRYRSAFVFAGALLSMAVSLVLASFVTNTTTAFVYAIAFGLTNACIHAHYVYLWPHYFGRKHLGSIQGVAQTLGVIGASLGGIPLGFAFDAVGDYQKLLIGLSILPLLCAILALTLKEPDLSKYEAH